MMKFVQLYILLISLNSIQGKLIVDPVPSTVGYTSQSGISTCEKCNAENKFYPGMFDSLDNLNFDCEIPHVKKICDGHEEVSINIKNPNTNGLICEDGTADLTTCNKKRILNNTIEMSFNCSFLLGKLGVSNTRDNQVSFTDASEVSLNETTDCNNNGTSSWNIIQNNPTKYPTMYPLTTSDCYGQGQSEFIGNQVQVDIVDKCKTASITTRIIKIRKTNFITKQTNYLTEIDKICVNENVAENVDHTVLFEDLASQIDASGQKTEIQSLVEDQQYILNDIYEGDCDVSHFTDTYYEDCSLVKDIRDEERSRRNLTNNNCDLNRAELDTYFGSFYNDLDNFDYFWSFNVTEAINSMCYGSKNNQDDLGGDDEAGLAIKIDSQYLLDDEGHYQNVGFFRSLAYAPSFNDSEQYSNDYCRDINDAKTKADSLIPDVDILYTYYRANESLAAIQSQCNDFAQHRLNHYIDQAKAWFALHSADFADEYEDHENDAPQALEDLCDLIDQHGTIDGHKHNVGGYGGYGTTTMDNIVEIDRGSTVLNFGGGTNFTCEQLLDDNDKTKIYPHLKREKRYERKLVSISWNDAYVSGQMINQYASLKDVAMAFLNEGGSENQTRVAAQLIHEKATICNFTPQETKVADVLTQIRNNFTNVKSALNELGFDTDLHGTDFFHGEATACEGYSVPTLTLSQEESAYIDLGLAKADNTLINCANAERTHDSIITANATTTITELRNAISNFNIKNGNVSACPSLDTFDYDSLKNYEKEFSETTTVGRAMTQGRLTAFKAVADLETGYDASWSDSYIVNSGLSKVLDSIIDNQTALVEEAVQNRTDNCNEYVCALNEDFKFNPQSECTHEIMETAPYGDGSWATGNVLFKNDAIFKTLNRSITSSQVECNGDVEIDLNVNLNLPQMEQNLWHNIHDSDGFLYNQIPKDSAHDMWTVCALYKDGMQLLNEKSLHMGNADFADRFEMNFLQNRYSWRNVTRSGSTDRIDDYGSSNTCPRLCDDASFRRRRLLFKLGVYKKVENLNY